MWCTMGVQERTSRTERLRSTASTLRLWPGVVQAMEILLVVTCFQVGLLLPSVAQVLAVPRTSLAIETRVFLLLRQAAVLLRVALSLQFLDVAAPVLAGCAALRMPSGLAPRRHDT